MDLTKITTPFGLLDEATQEALKAHGGPWEWYSDYDGWRDCGAYPPFVPGTAYRVKSAPPKPREWWAVEQNGGHIGLWHKQSHAVEAASEYRGAEIIHVREVLE